MKVKVVVMPRKEALDPQGRAIKSSLSHLGFGVEDCRVGKMIEMEISGDDKAQINQKVKEMCEKLLYNPLIESYEVIFN